MIFLDPPFAEYGAPLAWRRLLKAAAALAPLAGEYMRKEALTSPNRPVGRLKNKA